MVELLKDMSNIENGQEEKEKPVEVNIYLSYLLTIDYISSVAQYYLYVFGV